jgi:hypothetical protein
MTLCGGSSTIIKEMHIAWIHKSVGILIAATFSHALSVASFLIFQQLTVINAQIFFCLLHKFYVVQRIVFRHCNKYVWKITSLIITSHCCYVTKQLKSAGNRLVRSRSTVVARVAETKVSTASVGEVLWEVMGQLQTKKKITCHIRSFSCNWLCQWESSLSEQRNFLQDHIHMASNWDHHRQQRKNLKTRGETMRSIVQQGGSKKIRTSTEREKRLIFNYTE